MGSGSLDVDCVFLNIGQHITAIAAGALSIGDKDLLFVGTPNNLLAYDVENNQDVFYKEVLIAIHSSTKLTTVEPRW